MRTVEINYCQKVLIRSSDELFKDKTECNWVAKYYKEAEFNLQKRETVGYNETF